MRKVFKRRSNFKVCLTANVSVWTARKKNVPIQNTKRHKMPTLRKFVRETITLREYEGSIYTNKGVIVMVLIKSSYNGNMCTTKR